jgi:hypothetical protein
MSSVASTNSTGVSDILQILSNSGSAVFSGALSTSQVQSTLKNASPSDIAQISEQAIQLQQTDTLFGISTPGQNTAPASLTDQLFGYQNQTQIQQIQSLFGISPTASPSTNVVA